MEPDEFNRFMRQFALTTGGEFAPSYTRDIAQYATEFYTTRREKYKRAAESRLADLALIIAEYI
jgi:flagellar biosynthesis/type III secretory pathway protein FliH